MSPAMVAQPDVLRPTVGLQSRARGKEAVRIAAEQTAPAPVADDKASEKPTKKAANDPDEGAGAEAAIKEEAGPSGGDKPRLMEETDESLQAFKESLCIKDASASWAAKFMRDAEAEAGMPVLDRMDRDGARYRHAEQQMNDRGLTEEEERDLGAAKRGAYARRDRMLSQMTKAEQRAYKPRRA